MQWELGLDAGKLELDMLGCWDTFGWLTSPSPEPARVLNQPKS